MSLMTLRHGARNETAILPAIGVVARAIAAVFVLDCAAIVAAVAAGMYLKFGFSEWPPPEVEWLTGWWVVDLGWVAPVWVLCLVSQDAYSRRAFGRGSDEFKQVARGSLLAAAAIAMTSYLINNDMSRGYYLYVFSIGTTLLLLERYAVRLFVRRERARGRLLHRVVLVGESHGLVEVQRELRHRIDLGYHVVGVCTADGPPGSSLDGTPVLGPPSTAVAHCGALGADTLVVAGGSLDESGGLRRLGWQLQDSAIDLVVVPSLIDVAGPRIHLRPVAGLPLMHVEPPQVGRAMKWGKAAFDRVGAALLILVLAPLLFFIAVAVRVDGPGPVLFRHQRVGVHGRAFALWKFRSMSIDAEERQEELLRTSDQPVVFFKLPDDPRRTRVGRVLRKYSLDELPQLFNVLRGEMSLVGPRPQVAGEVSAYRQDDHRRLLVRPGMTGLWQVSGRSSLSLDESMRLDLYYVDNWSMIGDLLILAKTVSAVLRHDGAY